MHYVVEDRYCRRGKALIVHIRHMSICLSEIHYLVGVSLTLRCGTTILRCDVQPDFIQQLTVFRFSLSREIFVSSRIRRCFGSIDSLRRVVTIIKYKKRHQDYAGL
jgi:hypothetical protein